MKIFSNFLKTILGPKMTILGPKIEFLGPYNCMQLNTIKYYVYCVNFFDAVQMKIFLNFFRSQNDQFRVKIVLGLYICIKLNTMKSWGKLEDTICAGSIFLCGQKLL